MYLLSFLNMIVYQSIDRKYEAVLFKVSRQSNTMYHVRAIEHLEAAPVVVGLDRTKHGPEYNMSANNE